MMRSFPQSPEQHGEADGESSSCSQWIIAVDLCLKCSICNDTENVGRRLLQRVCAFFRCSDLQQPMCISLWLNSAM